MSLARGYGAGVVGLLREGTSSEQRVHAADAGTAIVGAGAGAGAWAGYGAVPAGMPRTGARTRMPDAVSADAGAVAGSGANGCAITLDFSSPEGRVSFAGTWQQEFPELW